MTIHHWTEVQRRATALIARLQQLIHRRGLQLVHLTGFEIQARKEALRVLARSIARDALDGGATLHNRPPEQSVRGGHGHQRADLAPTTGLTKNRDVARVGAKGRNVVPHPLQRRNDVKVAHIAAIGIALGTQTRQVQVAQRREPVIHRHDDDVVLLGQLGAVIAYEAPGTTGEAATVQPHHDRKLAPAIEGGVQTFSTRQSSPIISSRSMASTSGGHEPMEQRQ